MSKYITVTPAYGRVLNSQKEVKEYFESGKDFQTQGIFDIGRYVNKQDLEFYGNDIKLHVRYGKRDEKVMIIP